MKIFVEILPFLTVFCSLDAISVTVYYESLCSDSVRFITRQLYPNFRAFQNYLTLDFVPYGKALHSFNHTTGKYSFNCQHGKEECKGNRYHACAFSLLADQETKLDFLTCVMSTRNPSNMYYIETCATKYNLDMEKLLECIASGEGDKLLASHGDRTWNLEPNLYFVPTIVFNNSTEIDERVQEEALKDFKLLLCKELLNDKPSACQRTAILDRIKDFFHL